MKRNCDLDLGLHARTSHNSMNEPLNLNHHYHHRHHVPIIQNGRHCLYDITELQARVIIWLASREMEERMPNAATSSLSSFSLMQFQALMCGHGGLSMKRSLESFLQKRKKKRTQTHNLSFTTTQ